MRKIHGLNCVRILVFSCLLLGLCMSATAATKTETPAARACLDDVLKQCELQYKSWDRPTIYLHIDPNKVKHREGFCIIVSGPSISITGGGEAGLIYGILEMKRIFNAHTIMPRRLEVRDQPDFELRGSVLFLMKEASYDYKLTPAEFPWFYDRELLTKYFDYLEENRFNTLFLWTGNLFPSIVEMPEYPDATDLSREELLRNQAQFKWFTDQCAQRNINVLLHFYQIHITKALAKSRNIPVHYRKPNKFVTKFMRYSLDRFLGEFKNVGLYVCPGEALRSQYQPDWIRDVIFAAAKASGHNPVIVVRDWTLDAKLFKKVCKDEYDNLYTELKHNVEMIVSPVPDPNHADWKGVVRKHIVNVHEVADVKPFRWGSPDFIHEMVGEWKRAGLDGAEVYGMISWRWPYSLDKLEPGQTTFWPKGDKLLTFERDWLWLEAIGRYLWKVNRDPRAERKHWETRLQERFGSPNAARMIRYWYQSTGPILPGLQNLTSVVNMNYHPTAVGKEQTVDAILAARTALGEGEAKAGNAGSRGYPSRPVDSYFFKRYKERFKQPTISSRISMPVSVYATRQAKGESCEEHMTPDKITQLFVELAEESSEFANRAVGVATDGTDELKRFATDSQALILISKAWQHKVLAAMNKALYLETGEKCYADVLLKHMDDSVTVYEELVEITNRTYVNASDMLMRLNWKQTGLNSFRSDRDMQKAFISQALEIAEIKKRPGFYWIEAEEMEGNWKLGTNYSGYFGKGFRVSDGPNQQGTTLTSKVAIKTTGRYAVWAHGLIGPGQSNRQFAVSIKKETFPPTHKQEGPKGGKFVWQKAGEIDLTAGETSITIKDAGSGYECPDVILLTNDLKWKPSE
jgi:hypothetical protein